MSNDEETNTPRSPTPKWLDSNYNENAKQSKKHERRLSQRLGGKRYSGSGNRKWSRYARRKLAKGESLKRRPGVVDENTDHGDIATLKFHFEHKYTRAQSLSILLSWLQKVKEGARRHMKDPGLIFTFQDQTGHPIEEWVAMPLTTYEILMRRVESDE